MTRHPEGPSLVAARAYHVIERIPTCVSPTSDWEPRKRRVRRVHRDMRRLMVLSRFFLHLLVPVLLASPAIAADPPMLVTVEWLSRQLERPDLRIVDMSTEREGYRTGHVPGAVYLNIDDVRIAVPAGGYRLPSAEEATRLFAALGIGPDTSVVIDRKSVV